MKTILELTKTRDEGDIFYRYDIDGTKVWFSQYPSNGKIYTVAIRPNEELHGEVEFYLEEDFNGDKCYPTGIYISAGHKRLTPEQVDEHVELIKYAKNVAVAIMDIFNSGIHKECYDKFHKICE